MPNQEKQVMTTRFEIHIPVFSQTCPEKETETTCALRQYLDNNKTYKRFPRTPNLLVPDTKDWKIARNMIDHMYEICAKCKEQR